MIMIHFPAFYLPAFYFPAFYFPAFRLLSWYAALSIACLAFASCGDTFVNNPEFLYEEKLVINGLLSAGDSVRNIEIVRLQAFSNDSTISVSNANAVLTVDGIAYPLRLQKFHPKRNNSDLRVHSYYEAPGLVAEAGKRYTLTVEWKGKKAMATTTVPKPLLPDSVRIYQDSAKTFLIVEAVIKPRPNEVYVLDQSYRYLTSPPTSAIDSLEFSGGAPSKPIRLEVDELAERRTKTLRSNLWTDSYQVRFRKMYLDLERYNALAIIYTFDNAFWDYYYTGINSNLGGNTGGFAPPDGKNIKWNVTGDGVGLFIGVATSRTLLRK
jgi:Domain of unknown function (DUF4249)